MSSAPKLTFKYFFQPTVNRSGYRTLLGMFQVYIAITSKPITIVVSILLNLAALKVLATLFNYWCNYYLLSYLGFLDDLYSKQMILQRINDDHHVCKVSVDDTVSVISIVFRPHNVYLVIANMTNLTKDSAPVS